MERITNTDKWKDDWFLDLSPNSKLTFIFLYENCDDAGFFKLSTKHMHLYLKLSAKEIVSVTQELREKIVFNNTRKKIWIKNFLFYQNHLPLEKKNVEHRKIKLILEKNLNQFGQHEDMIYIIKNQSSVKATRVARFIKPTQDEIKNYITKYTTEEEIIISEGISVKIFNHYQSNGWKVGKNPMRDWESAVRGWIAREIQTNISGTGGGGKINELIEATKEVNDVTVD